MSANAAISAAALAQARYALYEKLQRCNASLDLAHDVFGRNSEGPNVIFWSHEVQRVANALYELGGKP